MIEYLRSRSHKQLIRIEGVSLNFGNTVINANKSNHSSSNRFRKEREDDDRKRNSYFSSKSPVTTSNQYIKAYQNQSHPNEHPSSYPAKYYSGNSYDSRDRSTSRNCYSLYQSSHFRSLASAK